MDENEVKRLLEEGGRDDSEQQRSTSSSSPILAEIVVSEQQRSTSSSSPILAESFDHGNSLLVKSIDEFRSKKDALVTVGIGGPSGSGKTSLAEKVASVISCTVISMENYYTAVDDGNDLNSIDFDLLVENLEDLIRGKDARTPVFDVQEKKRIGSHVINASTGVVIVDGTYALHERLRSLLDIRVAVVGGVNSSLLNKVKNDIRESCSSDSLIDSIFPLFRKQIEPDLHHAQIRIDSRDVSGVEEQIYKLKCKSESKSGLSAYAFNGKEPIHEDFIEMYLRPPSASKEAHINNWIKVRQSGIKYYLSLGDRRVVDKNYIIRPKAKCEVGQMTLDGLLALGYTVEVSYKRSSTSVGDENGNLSISFESIDPLGETYMVLRGTNMEAVGAEASKMEIKGPWITKSYREMILERKVTDVVQSKKRRFAPVKPGQSRLPKIKPLIQVPDPIVPVEPVRFDPPRDEELEEAVEFVPDEEGQEEEGQDEDDEGSYHEADLMDVFSSSSND